jgi:hypothetical protein
VQHARCRLLLIDSRRIRKKGERRSGMDPEPKIWAASPDENTPWGPNQAVRSSPRGHGTEGLPPSRSLHRVMTSLWSPRVQVTPSRVLHGSGPWALAGWRRGPHSPRAPPGRPESQLEPPGGLARQRGPRLSSKQSPVKALFGINLPCQSPAYSCPRCVLHAVLNMSA